MYILYVINHIYGLILQLLFFVDVDECNSFPCENNGTCINSLGSYTCNCSEGWQNEDCKEGFQRLITVADQLIRNIKRMIFSFTQNSSYPFFLCFNLDIDECSAYSPCVNNGTCINTNGSYYCICTVGWNGNNCEKGNKFIKISDNDNIIFFFFKRLFCLIAKLLEMLFCFQTSTSAVVQNLSPLARIMEHALTTMGHLNVTV